MSINLPGSCITCDTCGRDIPRDPCSDDKPVRHGPCDPGLSGYKTLEVYERLARVPLVTSAAQTYDNVKKKLWLFKPWFSVVEYSCTTVLNSVSDRIITRRADEKVVSCLRRSCPSLFEDSTAEVEETAIRNVKRKVRRLMDNPIGKRVISLLDWAVDKTDRIIIWARGSPERIIWGRTHPPPHWPGAQRSRRLRTIEPQPYHPVAESPERPSEQPSERRPVTRSAAARAALARAAINRAYAAQGATGQARRPGTTGTDIGGTEARRQDIDAERRRDFGTDRERRRDGDAARRGDTGGDRRGGDGPDDDRGGVRRRRRRGDEDEHQGQARRVLAAFEPWDDQTPAQIYAAGDIPREAYSMRNLSQNTDFSMFNHSEQGTQTTPRGIFYCTTSLIVYPIERVGWTLMFFRRLIGGRPRHRRVYLYHDPLTTSRRKVTPKKSSVSDTGNLSGVRMFMRRAFQYLPFANLVFDLPRKLRMAPLSEEQAGVPMPENRYQQLDQYQDQSQDPETICAEVRLAAMDVAALHSNQPYSPNQHEGHAMFFQAMQLEEFDRTPPIQRNEPTSQQAPNDAPAAPVAGNVASEENINVAASTGTSAPIGNSVRRGESRPAPTKSIGDILRSNVPKQALNKPIGNRCGNSTLDPTTHDGDEKRPGVSKHTGSDKKKRKHDATLTDSEYESETELADLDANYDSYDSYASEEDPDYELGETDSDVSEGDSDALTHMLPGDIIANQVRTVWTQIRRRVTRRLIRPDDTDNDLSEGDSDELETESDLEPAETLGSSRVNIRDVQLTPEEFAEYEQDTEQEAKRDNGENTSQNPDDKRDERSEEAFRDDGKHDDEALPGKSHSPAKGDGNEHGSDCAAEQPHPVTEPTDNATDASGEGRQEANGEKSSKNGDGDHETGDTNVAPEQKEEQHGDTGDEANKPDNAGKDTAGKDDEAPA